MIKLWLFKMILLLNWLFNLIFNKIYVDKIYIYFLSVLLFTFSNFFMLYHNKWILKHKGWHQVGNLF